MIDEHQFSGRHLPLLGPTRRQVGRHYEPFATVWADAGFRGVIVERGEDGEPDAEIVVTAGWCGRDGFGLAAVLRKCFHENVEPRKGTDYGDLPADPVE